MDANPLVELSSLVDPADARHPVVREAIVRVTRRLRKLLRADRWPKPFQVAGVAYCDLAGDRALIADEMGLGKTPQALLRILLGAHVPALVVSPASVLLNWRDEAGFWLPGVPVRRLDRVATWVPPPGWRGIVVTTWDLLRHHSTALARMRPRIVVADECQALLNEDTNRAAHFDVVRAASPHLLLLSGTPLVNRPRDLWRLLNMVAPSAWPEGTIRAFKELQKDDFDRGVQSRLARRVRQYMLRRQKVDALPDLAPKRFRFLDVELGDAERARYQRIELEFAEWLHDRVLAAVLDEQPELSEEDAERLTEERSRAALAAQDLVQFGRLRQVVGEVKARHVATWVVEAQRAGEAVVVFCWYQSTIERIARSIDRQGVRFGVIDGKTAKTRRHSRVKEFQGGKIDVLIASAAAQSGITLHRARHVLFADRFLTAASEDQAVDRIHRIGQMRDVTVWVTRALGTVDERTDHIVSRKRRIAGRTVDTGGAPPRVVAAR